MSNKVPNHITTSEVLLLLKYFEKYYPQQYEQFDYVLHEFDYTGNLNISTINQVYSIDVSPKDREFIIKSKKLPDFEYYLHLSINDKHNVLFDDLTLYMAIEFFEYNFAINAYVRENFIDEYGRPILSLLRGDEFRKFRKQLLKDLNKNVKQIINDLRNEQSKHY